MISAFFNSNSTIAGSEIATKGTRYLFHTKESGYLLVEVAAVVAIDVSD